MSKTIILNAKENTNNYKAFINDETINKQKELISYLYSLKEQGIKIGLIIDPTLLDYEDLSKKIDLSHFSYVWILGENRTSKDLDNIYKKIEVLTLTKAEDMFLIDCSGADNLEAKERGWHVYNALGKKSEEIKNNVDYQLKGSFQKVNLVIEDLVRVLFAYLKEWGYEEDKISYSFIDQYSELLKEQMLKKQINPIFVMNRNKTALFYELKGDLYEDIDGHYVRLKRKMTLDELWENASLGTFRLNVAHVFTSEELFRATKELYDNSFKNDNAMKLSMESNPKN